MADQLFVGLTRVLGAERVTDYPWKAVYHDPDARLSYVPQVDGVRRDAEEVGALLRDGRFDLVVLSSPRAATTAAAAMLARVAPWPVTVLIDGEDDSDIRCDLYRRYRCRLYFKREYRWMPGGGVAAGLARRFAFRHCSEVSTSIFPLPFSVIPGVASPSLDPPRDVDVSYVVRASHPKRIRAYTLLRAATDLKTETAVYADASDRQSKLQTGLPKVWTKLRGDALATEAQRAARLPYDAYRHLLARSKMALSVRGGGFDTLRYWEIVSSKALLVSETPDILIPNNFESGKHALFCKPDLSDLVPLIRRYVHEDAARGAMVDAAYAHLHAHHTCSHRARYLLDLVRQYA